MRHGMESSMLYSAEDTQATTCCNVTGKQVVARRLVTMSQENKSSPDDLLQCHMKTSHDLMTCYFHKTVY